MNHRGDKVPIGARIAAYEAGRRDARADGAARWPSVVHSPTLIGDYELGRADERARMRARREHPQLELDLFSTGT